MPGMGRRAVSKARKIAPATPSLRPPIAVSLFSGAGGMDLGIRAAGFQVAVQVERDHWCCESLRAENQRTDEPTITIEQDITTVEPQSLLDQMGVQPGDVDLLFGGPPCQTFSAMGKRASLADDRGLLLFQMVRFAEVLQPRAVLIENVKGLLNAPDAKGRRGGVVAKLRAELEKLGYTVAYKVLHAADYGVPQARDRLFIVATEEAFSFPAPTHGPIQSNWFGGLKPYVTVAEALRGLGKPLPKGSDRPADSHYDVTPARDRERITYVPKDDDWLSCQPGLPAGILGTLTPKDSTKFRRLGWNKPSLTLRCGETFYHPSEHRYLTPREYLRLHGYPDEFKLMGPIRGRTGAARDMDQHRQVANSVPPPLAKAVAGAVLETLQCRKSTSSSDSPLLTTPQ